MCRSPRRAPMAARASVECSFALARVVATGQCELVHDEASECDGAATPADTSQLRRAARSGDGLARRALGVDEAMHPRRARPRDYLWGLLAVATAVLLLTSVIGALWQGLVGGDWSRLLSVPIAVLFWFWIGMGDNAYADLPRPAH